MRAFPTICVCLVALALTWPAAAGQAGVGKDEAGLKERMRALVSLASLRSAPLSLAPLRLAPLRSARLRSAPLRSAPLRSVPMK